MSTFVRFNSNIRKRANQVRNAPVKIVRRTSKKVLRALVTSTPVDKGVARSNWRASIGNPTRSVIPAYAYKPPEKFTETRNARAAISAGIQTIDRLRRNQALFITNSVPYITDLNAGRSKQAAPGWIETALDKGRDVISNFRIFDDRDEDDD